MDNNPNQFGQTNVSNQFGEKDTHDTTTRDSENSRDGVSSRYESQADWERVLGARNMGVSCFWHFDKDQIIAKCDGTEGHGDTVADALGDLAKRLRRQSD